MPVLRAINREQLRILSQFVNFIPPVPISQEIYFATVDAPVRLPDTTLENMRRKRQPLTFGNSCHALPTGVFQFCMQQTVGWVSRFIQPITNLSEEVIKRHAKFEKIS